ncbi:hypothetical protein VOLCADRAFT_107774 [Volvox carteri f. nagariensis]|uniref:Uncharacterized protein n=1 Tax=Volvox carteri f. nagariensis TaxID=3068 RepID=D8UGB0_VOLCA|nr:uncharacterized protein VOLCADRAFT_107774 [Volvox carteri f. nagariensis]EFJ41229.1 hypothetical protein VOLCADRAFT_107774 [Volvox carteri f. nagariensis]|eukprot:XP_002957680.1 hypothetical protein VOLCADRAFT_107774 [Volvox carteri f. nagariensis]
MSASFIQPTSRNMGMMQKRFGLQSTQARLLVVPTRKRLAVASAAADDAPSDDYHLTADTIIWNAKHSAILRQRIAQVRAAEVVAESSSTRPELPPVNEITSKDVEQDHSRLCQWHEDQWQRLASSQPGLWDDELGHFGVPS